jgi:TetR/AcrR family transcriptional repressor of nem operon
MPSIKTSKEEIIQKSAALIWEKGYKHTSFSDLSKACAIRNAHFFYYFKDKEDLMSEVLLYASGYMKKKVFDIAYQDNLSTTERLEIMGKKLKTLYCKNNSGCMFANITLEMSHSNASFLEIVRSIFRDFIAALTHIYEIDMPAELAEKKAIQAVQQIEGALIMMRIYDDKSYIDNAWQTLLD